MSQSDYDQKFHNLIQFNYPKILYAHELKMTYGL